uniref:FAD synthase n=1 Tax=Cacopsylla melanoneura TaxID=428564 RepID=A0A8D8M8Y9_9HEMI
MIGLSVQSVNCSPLNPTRLITGHSILTRLCRNKFKHLMATNDYKEIKTCGIVVIGDEILKAQVEDTNSRFLCKTLRDYGIRVTRISVIPDDIRIIANEVRTLSEANNYVITTGGIGPTHDDVTYESLALAFNQSLALNPDLLSFWTRYYPLKNPASPQPTEAAYKFSNCPARARVVMTKLKRSFSSQFPVLNMENVYTFPGTPSLVEKCFPSLLGTEIVSENKFYTYALHLNVDETLIVTSLNDCVNRHQSVIFGSYPIDKATKITLEARTDAELAEARSCLVGNMTSFVDVYETVMNNESLTYAKHSLEVIAQCLDTYSLESCFLSFNGGKDCTLLLHLVNAVLKHKSQLNTRGQKLLAVYFKQENSFPEVEQFVKECVERYNLELVEKLGPMKEGLAQLLVERPHLKAVFMGSRRGDPRCSGLTEIRKTDSGWPEIMRINPLLDWTYQNVWKTIREFNIPYCTLYDQGYSSLGSVHNTTRNPALVQIQSDGTEAYLPPDRLLDDLCEREGRL